MQPYTAHIDVGEHPNARRVGVREITAGEIRTWLLDIITPNPAEVIDLADYMLFEDEGWRLADFKRMTDLTDDSIATLTPSDLEAVYVKCKEVNPRFFTALARLMARGLAEMQEHGSQSLSKPVPFWRRVFMRMSGAGRGRL